MSDLLIMTWLWQQTPARHDLGVETVNRWAAQIRAHVTVPHRLAVVSRMTGFASGIEVIEPPGFFEDVEISTWKERHGSPQCYRRLAIYHPDAARIFGAEWILQLDVDMIALQSLDPIALRRDADFRILQGTTARWPYNGSMQYLRAGSRPRVFERFASDPIGVATAARKLYVGSDQAVIPYVLGAHERTFTEQDGVYCYSAKMVQASTFRSPPASMRAMFFPGEAKPWNSKVRQGWIKDAWFGTRTTYDTTGRATSAPMLKLHVYRDLKGWGVDLARAAQRAKIFCTTFTRPSSVMNGMAFVRLDQQGSQRDLTRNMVRQFAERGIPTLPTAREARWYDDKGAQLEVLSKWMPKTAFVANREEALGVVGSLGWPMVSKSIDGSASKGVRLLQHKNAARREVEQAFTVGIPSVYDRQQRGYVYWQEFVPNNPCDYRVCVIGDYAYGLVRNNRPNDFRASGSGDSRPIELKSDREFLAVELCSAVAREIGTEWMAFDVVFNGTHPLILEMSSAWTLSAYGRCPMYERDGFGDSGRTAAETMTIAVDVIKRIWARHVASMQRTA